MNIVEKLDKEEKFNEKEIQLIKDMTKSNNFDIDTIMKFLENDYNSIDDLFKSLDRSALNTKQRLTTTHIIGYIAIKAQDNDLQNEIKKYRVAKKYGIVLAMNSISSILKIIDCEKVIPE